MPRLVRRAPLSERIKAYLDPYDLLLRLAEEFNDDTYDEWLNEWATAIGIGLNILFILARGASKPSSAAARDDVFGDPEGKGGSGWFAWFATFIVQALTLLCCVNTLYTFIRKRNYRLFEHSIDETPATPSAHRVRVSSSPASSSPFQIVKNIVAQTTASSRAHPDPERDVWELRVWDPKPFHLKIFTLFSPGHVLLYFSLLPPAALDPRPSVTVVTAIAFAALLSAQLILLRTAFAQQAQDSALVHGEVMHEYDAKFVQPALNPPVRDVGTQTRNDTSSSSSRRFREVDVYPATTVLRRRGFHVHPNPNYAGLYDPDSHSSGAASQQHRQQFSHQPSNSRKSAATMTVATTPSASTPAGYAPTSTHSTLVPSSAGGPADYSSPLKQHHERGAQSRWSESVAGNGIYGGGSPARRTASGVGGVHLRADQSGGVLGRRSGVGTGRTGSHIRGGNEGFDDGGGRRRATGRY